jgi:streptogramin lyase
VLDLPLPGLLSPSDDGRRVWVGSPEGFGWLDVRDGEEHIVTDDAGAYVYDTGGTVFRAALYGDHLESWDLSGEPRRVARAPLPAPFGMALADGSLWVTDHFHSRLRRVDPADLHVEESLPVGSLGPDDARGEPSAAAMAAVDEHLWVVSKWDVALHEYDAETGAELRVVPLGADNLADGLSVTPDGLWVWVGMTDPATGEAPFDTLVLVDPQTGEVRTRLQPRHPEDLVDGRAAIVCGPVVLDGETWLPVDDRLVHLDPDHGWAPDREVPLPDGTAALTAVAAGGFVWIYSPAPAPAVLRATL